MCDKRRGDKKIHRLEFGNFIVYGRHFHKISMIKLLRIIRVFPLFFQWHVSMLGLRYLNLSIATETIRKDEIIQVAYFQLLIV